MRITVIILRLMIIVVIAMSCVAWLFLGACRRWATDPQSIRWHTAEGTVLEGESRIDCPRGGTAVVRGSEAWWACRAMIGYAGDERFPHLAIAWVDMERAEGILVPVEASYSLDVHTALIPAAPPERAILTVYSSRRDQRFVRLARVVTPNGWVGGPAIIEASEGATRFRAQWREGRFEVTFQEKGGAWQGAFVGLDGTLSAMSDGVAAPVDGKSPSEGHPASYLEPEPPPAELVCSGCRLVEMQPAVEDIMDGLPRIRRRWQLATPPEARSRMQGERESGDRLEVLPGGLQVISGEDSAGILHQTKLVNRTHSLGFSSGGWDMIWFQRPAGGLRLVDDDGWYVTLDENMHRTDPLWPHEHLVRPNHRRIDEVPIWGKFAMSGWLLAALPAGIGLLWNQSKLKRKKLAIALLALYALSLYVSMNLLWDSVRLTREQPARVG